MDQPLCFIETNVGHGYAAEAGDVANNWHTFRGKRLGDHRRRGGCSYRSLFHHRLGVDHVLQQARLQPLESKKSTRL
ncbi:hypothetical protein ACM8BJ_28570, partial [Pseudomonas aeruginosa]